MAGKTSVIGSHAGEVICGNGRLLGEKGPVCVDQLEKFPPKILTSQKQMYIINKKEGHSRHTVDNIENIVRLNRGIERHET